MPILKGEKVQLRPYRREDQEHILSWANDPETVRNLTHIFDRPYTHQQAQEYLDRMLAGSNREMCFVIADGETGDYLGQIDLHLGEIPDRKATLGIVIARGEDRGRGLGQEAIGLICRYGFMTLGLNRIELTVHGDNARARLCYLKCGFREEGVQRQAVWKDGAFRDLVLMALLREEYGRREDAKP